MRSYATGAYDLTKDGNFQVHLHRMQPDDWIVVPHNSIGMAHFVKLGLVSPDRIIYADYGVNAYETRKEFWSKNWISVPEGVDRVVTNLTGCPIDLPTLYYLEITSHPLIPRIYVDEFFARDVASINESKTIEVQVFNEWQIDRLEQAGAAWDKINVNQKVVNPKVLDKLFKHYEPWLLKDNDIFFPFRLTDPCYKFEFVKKMATMSARRLVITDPNESYVGESDPFGVFKFIPTKDQFYSILKDKPTIFYMEDPDFCFHPGLGELIYFDCNIISPYKLPSKDDILIS